MKTLLSLKTWQLRMFRNSLRQGGRERRRPIMQAIALAIFAAFIFQGASVLFRTLASATSEAPPGVLPTLQLEMLSSIALGMLLFLLMTGLRSVNESLFQASDLPFLLAQPMPTRTIFAAKFLDAYTISLAFLAPIALAAWIAFGAVNNAPILYYALAIIVTLFGTLLFHSLVVLLLLVIMRFVPGQTMKQMFLVLSGLGAVTLVLGSQVFASRMVQESLQDPLLVFETVGKWGLGQLSFLPHVWITKAILLPFPAFDYSWIESLLPLIVMALAVAAFTIHLSDRLYARGWASGLESPTRSKRKTKRRPRTQQTRWPEGPFWAIFRKDLLLLKREPLVWYHLVVGSIVIGFFFYNISGPGESGVGPMVLLMPLLMAAVTSTQLGGIGISREGSNWWLLRTHAIQPATLYWSKFLYALLPPMLLVTAAAIVVEYFTTLALYPLPFTLVLMWLMTTAIVAFQLLLDILTPDFTIKIEFGGSRKNSSGTTKLLVSMFAVMLYVVAIGFLLFLPALALRESTEAIRQLLTFGLVGALTAATLITSYMWGIRRLHRLLTAED